MVGSRSKAAQKVHLSTPQRTLQKDKITMWRFGLPVANDYQALLIMDILHECIY